MRLFSRFGSIASGFPSGATLLNGLVAYYNFDEASGNLLDQVNSYDGTVVGATQNVSGKIGTAYSFDGVNDYVNLGSDIAEGWSELSISCWFNIDTLTTGGIQMLVAKYGSTAATQSFYLGIFDSGSDNTHQLRWFVNPNTSNTAGNSNNASTNLSTATWYHAVLTWKNSTKAINIYLNGSNDFSGTVPDSGNLISIVESTLIGSRISGTGAFFDGTIDEVGIWNRELTSSEVIELYNSGTGKTHPFT